MHQQQAGIGMADESFRIIVRRLRALGHHDGRGELYRFADPHVAGLAAIDDVGLGNIDLLDGRIEFIDLFLQSTDLGRSEVHHVVGDVIVERGLGLCDRLDRLA